MDDSNPQDFLVKRGQLQETRWAPSQTRFDQPLAAGEALLKVDRYAFTANNITYALLGELAHYWDFFPAEAGWGRIPVWGYADVVASRVPELPEGERIFGYLPMSPLLKVQPEQVAQSGFQDASEQRRALPAVYQRYMRPRQEDPMQEDARALLQPLVSTGFLIADWLVDNKLFGAQQILIGSASSKTALATAFMLSQRSERDFQVVGLTSPHHRVFCERVGYYDRVVEYEAVQSLRADLPSVFVDMSGAPEVRRSVHQHFGDALRFSSAVGITHGILSPPAALPGPQSQFFFAPAVIDKLQSVLGPAALQARLNEAQSAFYASARSWLEVQRLTGRVAIEAAYHQVRSGLVAPQLGIILAD